MGRENGSRLWKNSRSENWCGAVNEIQGWKMGVKNSKMENQWEKLESVKILGWKIGIKNSSQKMTKNWTN